MKILIVDDDDIARMALSNIVHGIAGVDGVAEAADGEQAWDLLQGGLRPVLCCCDIVMPRLDGLGLLRRTRAHPVFKDLPMVLISSASDPQTVHDAIAGGVAGYILKPFLAVQTRATIERVLRERVATEAEPLHATRRRLRLEPGQLREMTTRLRQDAAECREALAGQPAAAPERLQQLQRGAATLGLWRAAALLKDVMAGGLPDRQRLVLQELDATVEDRLSEFMVEPGDPA